MIRHNAFREYYMTSEYRGFRKVNHRTLTEKGITQVTFINGNKRVEANGRFTEQALKKAFKAIDAYYLKKQQRFTAAH